jgi:hypothetical protein
MLRMALPPIKRAIVGGSLAELLRILLPRTLVNKGVLWRHETSCGYCAIVVGIFLAPFVLHALLLLFAALGRVLIVLGLWPGGYGPD